MKHPRALCLLTIALLLGGCSGVVVRKYSTHGQDDPPSSEVVSDAPVVARSPAVRAESDTPQLDGCGSPIGVIDVVEDTSQDWYQTLTTRYQLPATTPLLHMLIERSGCFRLADPVRSHQVSFMGAAQSERDRALYGDLGSDWDIAYTLAPSINFAPVTETGTGMRKLETSLTLTDARSGAQVIISLGTPSGFSFGALVKTYAASDMDSVAYLDVWHSTPQGRAISDAFMAAFNQALIAVRKHEIERAEEMGRRTGYVRDVPTAVLMPVRQAQSRLAELNFYSGAIDGVAGAGMAKALSDFQHANGLRVTGQLDLASSTALAR